MSEKIDDAGDYVWKVLGTETVARTPYYDVARDRLRHPHGHELDYYVVRPHRMAVGIVPVGDDGRVLLVRQWRHPVQKLLWEIPAGAIEPGEDAPAAATRELREETGYAAGDIERLYRYHPTIGSSSQTFNLFVGQSLTRVGDYDPKEILAIRWFTRADVETLIDDGEMVDGMSVTALLVWLRKNV
jgi:ADP-ribose pyrophosphatase